MSIGSRVERFKDGFYEGVWDSDFAGGLPVGADAAFGSGMAIRAREGPLFLVPRHPYECVWVLQGERSTFVSNSLPFALEAAEIPVSGSLVRALEGSLADHAYREGQRGVDGANPVVVSAGGWRLLRLVYFDFTVDDIGEVRRHWSPASRLPSTYVGYRDLLKGTLSRLIANAADPRREFRLEPLVAVSRGYDSTAVAALVAQHPTIRVATLDVTVTGTADGGQAIADSLGSVPIVFRHVVSDIVPNLRFDFTGRLAEVVGEFIATGGVGDDVTFLPLEPALAGSILLTGAYGDSIWSMTPGLRPGLALSTPFGKSLTEFRVRVGFAHVPVPVVGARFNRPIKQISRSRGMQRWSIGGDYDRPIPRRIAEEVGVPRHLFGQQKAATAPLVTNHGSLFASALTSVRERYRQPRTSPSQDGSGPGSPP